MGKRAFIFAIFLVFAYLSVDSILVQAKNVHSEYEWVNLSLLHEEPEDIRYTRCFPCHKSMGVTGGGHQTDRKYCEDCHVPGQSGPFVYYEPSTYYLNFNYSKDVPRVYYHIANLSSSKVVYKYKTPVFIEPQLGKVNGSSVSSCFDFNTATGEGTCHGISSLNSIDNHFGFNVTDATKKQTPYPYHNTVERSYLPNSTNCLYCHRQSNATISRAFAFPSQINTSHFNSDSNEQCYSCHVDPSIKFTSFHAMGPEPEIIYLEQLPPTPTPPPPLPEATLTPETPAPTTLPPETPPATTLPSFTTPPSETTSPPETPAVSLSPQKKFPVNLIAIAAFVVIVVLASFYYVIKKKSKTEEKQEEKKQEDKQP